MKMKLPILAFFMLTLMLMSGCASKKPASPDWISGDSENYKIAQYLIGRGHAATEEEAKDRARADIAKVFQIAVVASSDDAQKFRSSNSEAAQYESQSSRSISTSTGQIVHGIQIAELWQDPSTKNYHVLAILPRLQTAASLRQQISQLDEATGSHIEQSRQNIDLFLKISAANEAFESEQERELLEKSLQIVDITGRAMESPWNSAKLNSDLNSLLKRVRITSKVAPDSAPGLEQVVAGALAKAGFLIETGENPEFVLHSKMELADLGFKEGWYWQRGVLEVSLSESATGRVRGTKRWVIKSNAPDKDSAEKRALNQVDSTLKKELRTAIIEMATNH
jgi:hypothetical protein